MASHTIGPFPAELLAAKKQIRERASSYGLDFFPVIYEMCDYEQMNQIAAYGGFPQRYPHWRFGAEYERLRKQHFYGLGRIYEMVINNDPCYAYLQESNPLIDQKLAIAHAYASSAFSKNNDWFSRTNRKPSAHTTTHPHTSPTPSINPPASATAPPATPRPTTGPAEAPPRGTRQNVVPR